jgi:hypothetical protein
LAAFKNILLSGYIQGIEQQFHAKDDGEEKRRWRRVEIMEKRRDNGEEKEMGDHSKRRTDLLAWMARVTLSLSLPMILFRMQNC